VAGFLAIAGALNYADRAVISSVLPALRTDFTLTDAQLGLLGSVFLWAYAIASPFAGILADRWPRPRMVIVSLTLWSGVMALTGVSNGLLALLGLRCALGLTESLYLPAATALLADHHGPETRGRAMGMHSVGINLGVVFGGACAGYLADHFGWRTGFLLLGFAGLALALVAGRYLRAGPPAAAAKGSAPVTTAEALRYLMAVPSYHVLLAKAMLAGIGIWVFFNWLPLFFRETFDMSLGAAGFAGTFMLQISTVIGIAAGGWISDRAARHGVRHRMLVLGLSYLVSAPFLLLFLARPAFFVVGAAISMFSLLRGLGLANENPTLCEVVPVQFRSTAIGLMNTCATAAGGAGVLLAGVLKQALGLDAIFAGLSLLFVIAGVALLVAHRWWMPRDVARAERYGQLSR
jgi:predicted MFS family arabinose efflux permease